MIKKLISGLIAGLALAVPGEARLEDGTKPLLELMSSNGIALRYNNSDCTSGEYLGLYRHRGMKRAMVLCYGATVDAEDHMVVRHEAIHAIQHCVNAARGTSTDAPIINNPNDFAEFVMANLPQEDIEWVKSMYPESQWLTELEAFAGANAYTSSELEDLFLDACTIQEDDV